MGKEHDLSVGCLALLLLWGWTVALIPPFREYKWFFRNSALVEGMEALRRDEEGFAVFVLDRVRETTWPSFSDGESADVHFYYLAFNTQTLFRTCSQWGMHSLPRKSFLCPDGWEGCKIHWAGVGARYQSPALMPRPKASVLASSALGRALGSSLQQLLTNARKGSPEVKKSVSEQ